MLENETKQIDSIFVPVLEQVKEFLGSESSGHDTEHALRVFNLAMHIQALEGGDQYVIGVAALTHDICRPWEKKTGKSHFGPEALGIVKGVLYKAQVQTDKIEPILQVIAEHDLYDWSNPNPNKSLELQIVQDADNLDALGAIGIARTFAFGGSHGLTMYEPGENLAFDQDFVEDPNHRTSTIAHFYDKLLKIKDHMNTSAGKKLAEKRHQIMEDFLEQFFKEWKGEIN